MTIKTIDNQTLTDLLKHAEAVFIADLHLDITQPLLLQAFNVFLDSVQTAKPTKLYILGDWFNAWIGDDNDEIWLKKLANRLADLPTPVLFCRGNRDFLLGKSFLKSFHARLLKDVSHIKIGQTTYRIEHGDLLCTDDKKYQRYRKLVRFPLVKALLLSQSLTKRQLIAQKLRQKSQQDNKTKTDSIMDVNHNKVCQSMQKVDVMIHGHTHRPDVHQYHIKNDIKKRYVLGDWRMMSDTQVQAVIGMANQEGFYLYDVVFDV